ncbi:MAG: radical SAM protein [Dehalococcoidia bacterium]
MAQSPTPARQVPQQRQRQEIFLEVTRSVCPVCRKLIDAQISMREGKIYMRKRCADHGWFETLLWSDAKTYVEAVPYNRPGTLPLHFNSEVREGCPYDCGLCPEHKQHTCVGIIEVTGRCNLDCPVCFAGEEHTAVLSLEEVDAILENLLRCEEWPDVVQFSGGEPTVHPQIIDMIRLAKEKRVKCVMLNTNGLRLANDRSFVAQLAELRPYIYLQFDGLTPQTYQTLRGRNLLDAKLRALDNLEAAGLGAVLVYTVVKGVNDHEIGDVVKFGLQHPAVRGVSFQPVFHSGRHLPPFDPMDRITIPDVMRAVEEQTGGIFKREEIIPIPCCFPTCSAASYALTLDGEVIPLPRLVNVADYMDYFTNRAIPEPSHEVMTALESLWSATVGAGQAPQHLCTACGIDFNLALEALDKSVFLLLIVAFMDEYNFDLKAAMKCCVHELLPGDRIIPFCVYNTVGYRERERGAPTVKARSTDGLTN